MRFTVILIALLLLPVMVAVQTWDFTAHQMPGLAAQARAILQREGVHGATVDLRYLDLSVIGDVPDAAALARATGALKGLQPTRLVHDDLSILAHVEAAVQGKTLVVRGSLPADCSTHDVARLMELLRPDLKIDISQLQCTAQARWPDGESPPITAESALMKGVVAGLRVPPSLVISPQQGSLVISGVMPDEEVKESIVRALREAAPKLKVDASALSVTPLIEPAPFTEPEPLLAFLRSFYRTPVPGSLSITTKEGPRLKAMATPTMESEWLALLRPLTGGMRVAMDLTLYPSIYHFPGYPPITPLPAEKIDALRQSLSDFYVVFERSSAEISASSRARLAGLVPTLLAAGPNLRLIVGGHPETDGQPAVQRRLALARAEQVLSYLIEQGAPTTDIQAVAFDPVPAGTPGAPLQNRSVEILIK